MNQNLNISGERDPVLSPKTSSNTQSNDYSEEDFLWDLEQNLEKAIRKSINLLDYRKVITQRQVKATQELTLTEGKISSLKGIEEFTNLTNLDLSSNNFSNEQLQYLENLTNLEVLRLDSNNLSDLKAIANLTKLRELSLNNNQIEDISILANLTQLESLSLNYNSVSAIEVVKKLTNLKEIYLDGNKISGLGAIATLTKLEILSGNDNEIATLDDFIHNLSQLRYLSLRNNQIKAEKMRPLVKLTQLQEVHLDGNQISDVRFLGVLSELRILTLTNNPITDSEPLNSLTNLEPFYQQLCTTQLFLEMVYIPGGKFLMGTPGNENESPQHEVTVSPFVLGKYPVTQAQYRAIMGDNPSNFQGDNLPVENVSWDQAVQFCQKLSTQTGLEFRLPSEAEWEYACRAGSKTSYCFGEDSNQLKEYAWYYDNSNNQTHPVGGKNPNAWGLYDMHGNVWEWCADDWHDNYNGAPNDGGIWLSNSNNKVLRGGSWYYNADDCRCAYRLSSARDLRNLSRGFRVAVGSPRTT